MEIPMDLLAKPWLKSYKLGPYTLAQSLQPYPEVPLSQVLDDSAKAYPTQTAILFQGRSLRYFQLKSQADQLAGAFAGLGLEKGDRCCIFLPNCMEFPLVYWAVIRAGGVVVPTSILRTAEGLLHEAGSSNSRLLVCQERHLELALAIKSRSQVERIVVTSNEGYDIAAIAGGLPDGVSELRALLAQEEEKPLDVKIDPREDLCELAFTGGATGIPKGVMLTHFNRLCGSLQVVPWFVKPLLRGIAGKASVVLAIPIFHTYGNFIQVSAVKLGLRMLILPDPRDTQALFECLQEHRPFLVPGVPTQFMRLAEAGLRRSNAMLFSGAAPLPQEVAQNIKQKTGMSVSEGYGLTETASSSHVNLSAFSRILGFVSKEKSGIGVPCPDTECRLVDPETGSDSPAGNPGELWLRGPQVMAGYWPERGAGLTAEGWLKTGDIAVMDEDGYFQIVDRIKDMVNVSGMKVYTTQVDEVLFHHPAVSMAAAFGVPDPEIPGSERVMAVIQLKSEMKGRVTEGDIVIFCREHLPPYAVPKFIEFRDDLPLTVTEKVFKKALRDEILSRTQDSRR
jgi:long-chain acyl-CoA synthetase